MSAVGRQRSRHSDIRKDRRELLLAVEKAHKADIQTFISGHLSPYSLSLDRFQSRGEQPIWETSKYPSKDSGPRNHHQGSRAMSVAVEDMAHAFHNFSMATTLQGSKPQSDVGCSGEPCCSASLESHRARGVLDSTELFLVKGNCADEESAEMKQDCPYSTQPHLTGFRRGHELKLNWGFDNPVLKRRDLTTMSGKEAVKRHVRKLEQDLRKLPEHKGPSRERLAVFSKVFSDVCEGSPVFGSILRDIKTEYDLYLNSVLSSQSHLQDMNQCTSFEGSVETLELEAAERRVSLLEEEAWRALEENDGVRAEYEGAEVKAKQNQKKEDSSDFGPSVHAASEEDAFLDLKRGETAVSSIAQVKTKREQVWELIKQVQSLQKEIRETMVSTVTTGVLEEHITDTEAEITRLMASNEQLRSTNKELEQKFLMVLNRPQVREETKAGIGEDIKERR